MNILSKTPNLNYSNNSKINPINLLLKNNNTHSKIYKFNTQNSKPLYQDPEKKMMIYLYNYNS